MPPSCVLTPSVDADMTRWDGIIAGPRHTPFEGGKFHFQLVLPMQFPFKAPTECIFTTPIYLPSKVRRLRDTGANAACGEVALTAGKGNTVGIVDVPFVTNTDRVWRPSLSLYHIVRALHDMLLDTQGTFDRRVARSWTLRFSTRSEAAIAGLDLRGHGEREAAQGQAAWGAANKMQVIVTMRLTTATNQKTNK